MHFCRIFELSKLLTGRENGSQKDITGLEFGSQNHLPDKNFAIKYHYRTGIRLSNIITERELGSQISLPEGPNPSHVAKSQEPRQTCGDHP